jgi:hypothetical protein
LTTFGQNNHAIRNERWRYIRYADGSEELYDHNNDAYEWTNLASKPEHNALKQQLAMNFPTINVPAVKKESAGGENQKPKKNGGKKPK